MADLDLLAAEYVLGTLDAETRDRLTRRLAREPVLRAAVQAWERRLPALDRGAASAEVAPELWGRISHAVQSDHRATVRAGSGVWETRSPGVERKTLFQDHAAGVGAYLLRIAPGAVLRQHGHRMMEQCLMLQGDVSFADTHLEAGDFHIAFPGAVHADITSRSGALFYVRGAIS